MQLFARCIGAIIALSALGFSSTAMAQVGPTDVVGGPSGAPFADQCGQGEFLVGFNYVKAKDMNAIAALCQHFSNGYADVAVRALAVWGDPNIQDRRDFESSMQCPPNTAVQQINVQVSNVGLVHSYALVCRNPNAHEYTATKYAKLGGAFNYGESKYEAPANCGGGAMAVGIVGRYGSLIDGLGLLCMITAAAPPPAAPAPPPPKAKPVPPPTDADDNTPTDVEEGDTGGGGATAATDTTIYDEPEGNDVAYLSQGDAVTIIDCNGNNWCQISAPQRGWVWGEDLNR